MRQSGKLKQHINPKICAKIILDAAGGSAEYEGYIVSSSDAFWLIQSIDNWHTDGLIIFPANRVAKIVTDDHQVDKTSILKWNNALPNDTLPALDLENYRTLFDSLRLHNNMVMVDDNDSAEVGKIAEINEDGVSLNCIDSVGNFVEEPAFFPFEDILSIGLDSEYINVLQKYSESREQISSRYV